MHHDLMVNHLQRVLRPVACIPKTQKAGWLLPSTICGGWASHDIGNLLILQALPRTELKLHSVRFICCTFVPHPLPHCIVVLPSKCLLDARLGQVLVADWAWFRHITDGFQIWKEGIVTIADQYRAIYTVDIVVNAFCHETRGAICSEKRVCLLQATPYMMNQTPAQHPRPYDRCGELDSLQSTKYCKKSQT